MPTNKPRVTFTLSDILFSEIENFRFENKCKNQSQAILELIEKGFEAIKAGAVVPAPSAGTSDLTNDELARLFSALDMLNDEGRERVVEYAEDVAACGRYKKIDSHKLGKKQA